MLFKKQLCARILSEANDLKRTLPALADDLNIDVERLKFILSGEAPIEDIYEMINRMGEYYPIDKSDLFLLQDDCTHSVKIMRASNSQESARVTQRLNRFDELMPYYEYRDTAMSRLAPFKPEWIQQLRNVSDADPHNPDVIYNNGHFMHQTTFFIGPVNFYWEVNGKRFCQQMNTGDSNYITPYWKHSFTCRDPEQTALILAITFGGSVRYAQKEFYALGDKAKSYCLDYRRPHKAVSQLIKQHMLDENMSPENMNILLKEYSSSFSVTDFFDEEKEKPKEELAILAKLLNIEVSDLLLPLYRPEDEVVITQHESSQGYYYPNDRQPLYRIHRLARTSKMPQMKGFNIEVLATKVNFEHAFCASTHTYAYNYSNQICRLLWMKDGKEFEETLYPGDSFYIQPLIKHALCAIENPCKLFMARAPGSISLATQRELSFFSDIERVIEENTCWFN